jgi:DUF971 family protein
MAQLTSIGKQHGALELVWDDGERLLIAALDARARCKCSQCQTIRMSTGRDPQPDPGVELLEIRAIGAYAVQLVFSDNHERGIFPYEYLETWRAR